MIGVVLFGTNCEQDVIEAIGLGRSRHRVHGDRRLPSTVDAIVLPGGFAHGTTAHRAIARFAGDDFAQGAARPRHLQRLPILRGRSARRRRRTAV
jgi:phosphoribosylformylglycinamidine (FGAM) synthase-like amidotransferase family enzyme